MRVCDKQKRPSRQKQAFLLLLVSALNASLAVASSSNPSQDTEFAHALALSAGTQPEQAYPLLESLFASDNASESQRRQAALILAFAPNSQLKLHKRHEYASDCLKLQEKSGTSLEASTRLSLLRIAADGCFDEKLFDLAWDDYLELIKEGVLKHQAYAEYRLGWIELNREKPAAAVKRWSDLIREKQEALSAQDPDLTRSIIRDLGKAWVESLTLPASALPNIGPFQSELTAGITLGLRRVNDEAQLIALKQKLNETPLGTSVFAELLDKKIVFDSHPCFLLEWNTSPKSSETATDPRLLPILISCARSVLDRKQCETPQGQALAKSLGRYELQGETRLPRISYELGCSNWKDACSDLLALENEQLLKTGKRLPRDQEDTLRESCLAGLPSPTAADSLMETLAQKMLLSTQESGDPLSPLLIHKWKDSQSRSAWLERLKMAPERYQGTWVPQALVEALSDQELVQSASDLLQRFAPKPINGPYLRALEQQVRSYVDQKRFSEARSLLVTYAPIQNQQVLNEELSNLWQYYWLGLPDPISDEDQRTLTLWKGSSDPVRTLALYLRSSQIERVWSESTKLLSSAHQKPELLSLLYQQTLERLTSKQTASDSLQKSLGASVEGRALLRLNSILTASRLPSPPEIHRISRDLRVPSHRQALAFETDLQQWNRLAELSSKLHSIKLRLNGLLPTRLARSLKHYRSEQALFEQSRWSQESSRKVAEKAVHTDAQWILDQVALLERKASAQPALAPLSAQLSELSRQLQVQLAASQISKGGSG